MWFWCVHTEVRLEYWVSSSGYYLLPWVRASQWPRSSLSCLASEFIGSSWFCSQCWGYRYRKLCQGFKVGPGIQIWLHLCRANALTHWAIPVLRISFYKIMASKFWVSQTLIFYIKIIDYRNEMISFFKEVKRGQFWEKIESFMTSFLSTNLYAVLFHFIITLHFTFFVFWDKVSL